MRVHIYRNLNRACWSIMAAEGERKGRVIGYADSLVLSDVVPKVSAAGIARIRSRKCRSVVAMLTGTMCDIDAGSIKRAGRVTFNPYQHDGFVMADSGAPFTGAPLAMFADSMQVFVGA